MNYKTLMDHINVLIWNLKDESTITMANKTLANFFGKDQKYYFLKNNNRNIFSVQENELIFKDNHKVFTEKQKVFTEKWIRDKTGRLRLLAITKVPKLNENGDIASVFCTAIDITEKASLRRALDITIDNLS